MSATATPGWAREHLPTIRPGAVALDQVEQLAVHQTLTRYAFALDQNDLGALEAVLTADASWHFRIAGQSDPTSVVGRASILDLVREGAAAETDQRRHHLLNLTIHSADSTTAQVHAYLMLTSNTGGIANLIATGYYTFALERVLDGWRITELSLGMDNRW